MKKERLKKIFTDAASDVADQFYPKGKTDRRGEFIRDVGVLWVKLEPGIDKYVSEKKKKPTALKAVMLAEDIMEQFENERGGIAADIAWYELVQYSEAYLTRQMAPSEFLKYLEIVFGFEGNGELATVKQKSEARYKEMYKMLYGEENV